MGHKKTNFINLFVNYSGLFVGIINTFIKSKTLSLEEIGLISTLITISGLSAVIINNGIPSIIQKFYFENNDQVEIKSNFIKLIFLSSTIFFVLVTFFLALFKSNVLSWYSGSKMLEIYYSYLFFFILFEYLSSIMSFIFRVEYLSSTGNIIRTVFRSFFNMIFLISLFILQFSFKTYLFLFISIQGVQLLLFILFFVKKIEFKFRSNFSISLPDLRKYATFGSFMFFSSLTGYITVIVDKLMIGSIIDLSQLGIYTISISLVAFIKAVGISFQNVYHPLISNYWHKGNTGEIKRIYSENANIQLYIGVLLFTYMNIFAVPMLAFFNKSFVAGKTVLLLVSIGELVNLGTGMCGGIITFSKYFKFDFYSKFFLMVLAVVTNILLIPGWGINGAACATLLSLSIYNIAKLVFVKIKVGMFPYNFNSLKIFTGSIIFFIIIYAIQQQLNLRNVPKIIVFCILLSFVYIVSGLYILKLAFLKKIVEDIKNKLAKQY